jgi:hypothetical protein
LKRILLGLAAGAAAAVAGLGAAVTWLPRGAAANGQPQLFVRQVVPAEDQIGVGAPGEFVNYEYELTNAGSQALTDLSSRLSCSCQQGSELPRRLAPAETARVSFRFRAPDAGTVSNVVTIAAGGKPVGEITAQVKANVPIPHMAPVTQPIALTVIRGAAAAAEFRLSCLEYRNSEPWLHEVGDDGTSGSVIELERSGESETLDPAIVRRAYTVRLLLDPGELDDELHLAVDILRTTDRVQIPVQLKILDPVAFFPPEVVFDKDHSVDQRISIVPRIPGAGRFQMLRAPEWLEVNFEAPAEKSAGGSITVRLLKATEPHPESSEIVVQWDGAPGIAMRIPVRVKVPQ